MRSLNYYRVRKLVRLLFWIGLGFIIYLISTRLWWDGTGYCVGTIERCGL